LQRGDPHVSFVPYKNIFSDDVTSLELKNI